MPHKAVGALARLWRFPVKSMLGEALDEASLSARGLFGDRAFALVEADTGKVVSAKNVKAYPNMFACRASYVAPTLPGEPLPPVRVTFPDGTSVTSDSGNADAALSKFFKRNVRLAPTAPDDFTIDEYHPDIEKDDLGPSIEAKLGSALFARVGAPSPVPVGAFFDAFPLSVISTSTLERLNALRPETNFNERRFRMNVVVRSLESGFVENDWVSKTLAIGHDVRLRVTMPDPRCVMTTLAQGGLPRDIEVLRTLTQHNRMPIAGLGNSPCAGVYAVITSAGTIRKDDPVALHFDE